MENIKTLQENLKTYTSSKPLVTLTQTQYSLKVERQHNEVAW